MTSRPRLHLAFGRGLHDHLDRTGARPFARRWNNDRFAVSVQAPEGRIAE